MQLAALEIAKAGLVETVSQKDVELASLGAELERVQSSLAIERETGVKAAEALQNQLNEKVKNWLHAKASVWLMFTFICPFSWTVGHFGITEMLHFSYLSSARFCVSV